MSAAPTKMSDLSDKNVRSNKDNTVNNTEDSNTNVLADGSGLAPLPSYGKPEINELFEYWAQQCQYNIETRVKANRAAASNLYKKYGTEKMHRLIEGVSMAQNDRFAPTIGDFCELQQKLPSLIVWGKKKMAISGVEVIS